MAGGEAGSDVAQSAISPEMLQAMLGYSPLRSAVSFSGGQVSYEQLEMMVAMLNMR